ncbi:MAG: hypothetical protein KA754_03160, partial [Corallincola sp.]|nr:hypothetical protein [Corallincola sp.]
MSVLLKEGLLRLSASVCLSAGLLVGCGGGGGGGGGNEEPPANVAPVVNAGADQTVNEGAAVTLAANASDTDGSIASYLWAQTAGPSVVLSATNAATAGFAAPAVTSATALTFRVTVTDDDGATAVDTVTVTVNNVNVTPVAIAGADQTINEGSEVTLNGSATDSDGTIASYAWSIIDGGDGISLQNANSAVASFTAPTVSADRTIRLRLTVTDNDGGSASDELSVVVTNVNQAPTLSAVNVTADNGVPSVVDLSAYAQDADGDALTFAVSGSGADQIVIEGSQLTFTPTAGSYGEQQFTLTVSDGALSASHRQDLK